MNVKFSKDTPGWIRDWVNWAACLLVPDWDITVEMVQEIDLNIPDNKGETDIIPEYLRAHIRYELDLQDTIDGRERVVHELCHPFVAHMSHAAENLISNKLVKKTAWKSYEAEEETLAVKLSRVLVALRDKIVLNSKSEGVK